MKFVAVIKESIQHNWFTWPTLSGLNMIQLFFLNTGKSEITAVLRIYEKLSWSTSIKSS